MRNTFHSDNLICGSEFIFFLHLNGDSDILYIVVLKHERKNTQERFFFICIPAFTADVRKRAPKV